MDVAVKQYSPRSLLTGVFLVSAFPFLMVELFRAQLYAVMNIDSYLVFHNIAEFFSVMVSLSIFGVGWYTYEQSKDRHALFLSAAFLAIGLMDFMHTLGYAGMPAFITMNSANKSTQFWIAVRLFSASAFLGSAFVYTDSDRRWLSKATLLAIALIVPALVFFGVTFFPSLMPATFSEGVGLTPFKKISEYVIIVLLIVASTIYWRRMTNTGDKLLVYYIAAFIICIFSELAFAVYKSVFDSYNVLGHVYKVVAFYLIYKGIFAASVKKPYLGLIDANEDIQRLNRELEQRVAERTTQLEAANKELEAFAFSVSHDLRAPLRSVSGFAKAVVDDYADRLDAQGRDYLDRIYNGSEKMTRLIEDLLHLSMVSRQVIARGTVDLSASVKNLIAELRRAQPERNVLVEIRQGVTALADHGLMKIVLTNLIDNAWKFTSKKQGASIQFGSVEENGKTVYYVKDNGAGFDPAYADKMFLPFQRLHTEKEFAGTGIGLTIVERIIRRHGGKVWAEGAPGKGATVYFTLG